jgi:hypothetical protein
MLLQGILTKTFAQKFLDARRSVFVIGIKLKSPPSTEGGPIGLCKTN